MEKKCFTIFFLVFSAWALKSQPKNDLLLIYKTFYLEDIQSSEYDLGKLMSDESIRRDSRKFFDDARDFNTEWDSKKKDIKRRIDEKYRLLELSYSKIQVNKNTLKAKEGQLEFLNNSLANNRKLLQEYEKQTEFIQTLLKNIVNNKKFYGIFMNRYLVNMNDPEHLNITESAFHDYGASKLRDYVYDFLTTSFVEDKVIQKIGLAEKVLQIVKNAETFNLMSSFPSKDELRKDTLIITTFVVLSVGNQKQIQTSENRYVARFNIKDKDMTNQLIYSHKYSKDTSYVNNLVRSVNVNSKKRFEEWFGKAKKTVDDSEEENQGNTWKDEITNYIEISNQFDNQKRRVAMDVKNNEDEMDRLRKEIKELTNKNADELNYWSKEYNNYLVLKKQYYEILKKREYYNLQPMDRTSDGQSAIETFRRAIVDAANAVQKTVIQDLQQTYLNDVNEIVSKEIKTSPVETTLDRLTIFDFGRSTEQDKLKIKLGLGFRLYLEVDSSYIIPLPEPNDPRIESLFNTVDHTILDKTNRLIWKRYKENPDDDTYGNSSLPLVLEKMEKAEPGWRLPTIDELKIFTKLISGVSPEILTEFEIVFSEEFPYWSHPVYEGKNRLKSRNCVFLGNNNSRTQELEITKQGYFLIVKNY